MPVQNTHPDYDDSMEVVTQVRDCYKGTKAVKEAGRKYLPMLTGQNKTEYEAYVQRGYFIPTIEPTVTAMKGAVMRKEPVYTIPSNLEYILEDINDDGQEMDLFLTKSLGEIMQAGRVGALVEHDGIRCRILMYDHESIINWSDDYIILKQQYLVVDEKDKYAQDFEDELLELTLIDGIYVQNIWRQGNNKRWGIHETIVPSNRGEALDYIPFACINTHELSFTPSKPAMLDISDIALDAYRLSTDLRHALHWTANPTPFVFADLEDDDGNPIKITMGGSRANVIPDTSARAEIIEFSGAGCSAISKEISEDVVTMAGLGAKMLATNTGGVKAAETARIEASSETASLSTMVNAVENFAAQLLTYCAMWEGGEGEVTVMMNRDFIDTSIAPQELTALLSTYTSGAISLETFLDNLKRGEILPKGQDVEDEIAQIEEEAGATVELDEIEVDDPLDEEDGE